MGHANQRFSHDPYYFFTEEEYLNENSNSAVI